MSIHDVLILALGAWIISIILKILNLQLTQVLEGYKLIPKSFFTKYQQEKFDFLNSNTEKITSVIEEYNKLKNKLEENNKKRELINLINKYELKISIIGNLTMLNADEIYEKLVNASIMLTFKLRTEYPFNRSELLPTSFGNIIRYFELYSLHVYGLDAIAVWTRIFQLVPETHKKSIEEAKSQVDFSVNLYYITIMFLIEYFVFSVITWSNPSILIPL